MDWSHKSLNILDLTKTEISILNALKNPTNVQDISQVTQLSRTGINHVIKKLIKKGLIYSEKIGKRNLYSSIKINQLHSKLESCLEEINHMYLQRKGAKIKTSKEDEFIIHVGADEIIPSFVRIARELKNERVRGLQHHKSFTDQISVATESQISDFNKAVIQNKIIIDGLLNESAYREYYKKIKLSPQKTEKQIKSLQGRMADYSVFPDDKFDFHSEIWIFNTTTLLINWKDEIAIEITNRNMTNFLRDMFEYVKLSSRKIDHNEEMQKLAEMKL